MKQYDSIKLEAARFERDAQRINLENAVIEGEKLRKEAAILDIELDTVSYVIKKELLSVVIQENRCFLLDLSNVCIVFFLTDPNRSRH